MQVLSSYITTHYPCSSVRTEQRFPKPRVARSSRARGTMNICSQCVKLADAIIFNASG